MPSLIVSYSGPAPDPELLEWTATGLVGGVVLFRDNAPDEDALCTAVATLRRHAPRQFRVMIDEEGGRVRRLPDAPQSMRDLRDYHHAGPDAVRHAYMSVADRLRALGIDTLLAPVADIGGSESSWLRSRTFSDDPDEVAAMVRSVIAGVQQRGVSCCVKHFPGMHAVAIDPHGAPAEDPTPPSVWERTSAVPFRAAIVSGVHLVMVGHQRFNGFDALRPACLSPVIVGALLRERLGFAGLVATDDLAMGAVTRDYPIEAAVRGACDAGCDLVLVCNDRALQRRAVAILKQRPLQ
ncbi:MAG: glycoside hydrolase family 3 N-terminal domain-containing protein [Candidatus Zixiibacteriota bacterium]